MSNPSAWATVLGFAGALVGKLPALGGIVDDLTDGRPVNDAEAVRRLTRECKSLLDNTFRGFDAYARVPEAETDAFVADISNVVLRAWTWSRGDFDADGKPDKVAVSSRLLRQLRSKSINLRTMDAG